MRFAPRPCAPAGRGSTGTPSSPRSRFQARPHLASALDPALLLSSVQSRGHLVWPKLDPVGKGKLGTPVEARGTAARCSRSARARSCAGRLREQLPVEALVPRPPDHALERRSARACPARCSARPRLHSAGGRRCRPKMASRRSATLQAVGPAEQDRATVIKPLPRKRLRKPEEACGALTWIVPVWSK